MDFSKSAAVVCPLMHFASRNPMIEARSSVSVAEADIGPRYRRRNGGSTVLTVTLYLAISDSNEG